MSRAARFEIVHSGPYKFHARFVAANNETVWVTESYKTRRPAFEAIDMLTTAAVGEAATTRRIRLGAQQQEPLPPPQRHLSGHRERDGRAMVRVPRERGRGMRAFLDWLLGAHCRLGCGERVFPLDIGLHERLEHSGDRS